MYTITIPYHTPVSWNKFYSGKHWGDRRRIADEWHELIGSEVLASLTKEEIKKIKAYRGKWEVEITAYFDNRNKMLDADNICSKLIIDGLKPWIPKDDPDYITCVHTASRYDPNYARTIIELKKV